MLTETMPFLAAAGHGPQKVVEAIPYKAPSELIDFLGVFQLDSYATLFHPAFVFLIFAFITLFLPKIGRQAMAVIAPAIAMVAVFLLTSESYFSLHMLGHEFVLLRMDPKGMAKVFAVAFTLYGILAGLYSWSQPQRYEKMTSLYLAAGGVGVVLCGDLLTLYFFWEILTIASMLLVWFGREEESKKAAFRYVILHLAGGVCLLSGALILINNNHVGGIERVALDSWPTWLLLIGMMVNAGVPPLHAWLPDAYPRASIYGTVYLAAFTTKSAVFILTQVFAGTEVLIWLGAVMALYGGVFAVLENNMRKLLGYHIVSQVGYMVCAVGIGTSMALDGAAAHAFAHIFYKGLLMMSAGAVIYAVGTGKLHALGGLGKSMKLTFLFCVVGGLSISGAPLFNGFVSKSLTMDATYIQGLGTIEFMLSVASMITFLSVGLKMPYFAFMGENRGAKVKHPVPKSMLLAMGISAALCLITGLPYGYKLLYMLLPYQNVLEGVEPYAWKHILKTLQLMAATMLVFWVLRKIIAPHAKLSLDLDRIYRFLVPTIVGTLGLWLQTLGVWWEALVANVVGNFTRQLKQYKDSADHAQLATSVTVSLTVIAIIALVAWMSFM